MKIEIEAVEGDCAQLYQWDLGRRLILTGFGPDTQAHFGQGDAALVIAAYDDGGVLYADIPNICLQRAGMLYVYIYSPANTRTRTAAAFSVWARPKPEDYVFTEDDIRRWDDVITAVQDEYIRMTSEDLLPALQEMYNSELASAKAVLEQTAEDSETAAKAAQQAAKTAEDAATASAASAQESASHNAACAESAANAETSAKAAAGHAQAMAGTFDFTGYLRYQIVEQAPETYDEGVLYIVAFT